MEVKIPDELIEQIYKGNTVLFVGSGLSAGSGLPTWPALMHEMRAWAEKHGVDLSEDKEEFTQLICQNKLLVAAEYLRERIGEQRFKRFMHSVFRDNTIKPSSVHTILPEIPFAAVLTTNYDVLLESAYAKYQGVRPRTYTQMDTPELADLNVSNEFYILKVHGDIDRIETVVLGQKSYQQAMFASEAYRDFLRTLFMSRTVLFVGFSLNDPDLKLLFDELGTSFKNYGGFHYALMSTGEAGSIQRRRWDRDYRIHIIPYEASKGHPEVYEILSEISEKVAERSVSHALMKVWCGLPHLNFIVEGSSSQGRRLFVEKLVDKIKNESRDYSFFDVHVDMNGVSDQEFFRTVGNKILQRIKTKYPSINVVWNEKDGIEEVLQFKQIVKDITSEIQNFDQLPVRVILLLSDADVLNNFHVRVKATLRTVLDDLSPTVTAVIVAQEIDHADSQKWVGSPWFSVFVSVRLE